MYLNSYCSKEVPQLHVYNYLLLRIDLPSSPYQLSLAVTPSWNSEILVIDSFSRGSSDVNRPIKFVYPISPNKSYFLILACRSMQYEPYSNLHTIGQCTVGHFQSPPKRDFHFPVRPWRIQLPH